ncbi:MAG TPA: TlpA disulfide reductase family protein [Syntrophales bacterium]|nr:TlpA disulfide reductase family protein [Syntrophales bacterium]
MKMPVRWLFNFILICSIITFFPIQNIVLGQGNQDDRAPDFTLKDLDGRNVRLSDYKGKTIVLYFMATWCPECRSTIPQLKEIYSSYNEKGLVLLSIDVMESKEKVAAFSRKHNIPYSTLLDEDGTVYRSYGVGGVPLKALIDRSGRIICWNCRSFDDLLAKQFEIKTK